MDYSKQIDIEETRAIDDVPVEIVTGITCDKYILVSARRSCWQHFLRLPFWPKKDDKDNRQQQDQRPNRDINNIDNGIINHHSLYIVVRLSLSLASLPSLSPSASASVSVSVSVSAAS